MPFDIYSTASVPQGEGFDYWSDLAQNRLLGLNFDIQPERRPEFAGQFRLGENHGTILMELRSSGHFVERSERNIADMPGGAIMLSQQLSTPVWYKSEGVDPVLLGPGMLEAGAIDRPFTKDTPGGADHHCRTLVLPMARFDGMAGAVQDMPHRAIETVGAGALLFSYLDSFWREFDNLSGQAVEVAERTLAQLLAVSQGVTPAHELTRDGVQEARRQRVRDYVEANLTDPALSPATAAAALGISLRQLHLLLEPTGISFSRLVQTQRVSRARAMLLARPDMRITAIAFACGFDTLSTFNRAFRAVYGETPGDVRRGA